MKAIALVSLIVIASAFGGWTQHKFNANTNPIDKMALQGALNKVSQESNGVDQEFVQVTNCEVQQVSGWTYKMDLLFNLPDGSSQTYFVQLYIVPWESKVEVQDFLKLGSISGAPQEDNQNSLNDNEQKMVEACQERIKNTVNGLIGVPVTAELLSTQIVSGETYNYKIDYENAELNTARSFECSVWYRPWLTPSITVTSVSDYKEDTSAKGFLESYGQPKEYKFNIKGNDESDQLAWKALNEYLEQENLDVNPSTLKVISAKRQLVSGFIYSLNIEFANKEGQTEQYTTKIWVQAWEKSSKVISFEKVSKQASNSKDESGRIQDIAFDSSSNDKQQQLAWNALMQYINEKTNGIANIQVMKAQQQIVSGTMFILTIKGEVDGQEEQYKAKIWVQEWENSAKVTYFGKVQQQKNALLASDGQVENFTFNPESNNESERLAWKALIDYIQNSNDGIDLSTLKVTRAQKQVVAGFIYILSLNAEENQQEVQYKAKIWVQAWKNTAKVTYFEKI